jgi:hypothetical protein
MEWYRMPLERWNKPIVVGSALLSTALVLAVWFNGSFQQCVQKQERLLIKGPYEHVPVRAEYAAQAMCKRNHNVPRALVFR